jgi:Protein of unknown function (DUF1203)
MTTITRSFDIRPIHSDVLAALRVNDDAGRQPRAVADDGGSPLRCCLRRSRGGESIVLASYAPLRRWARETAADPGPYDEVGPVYIHAEVCDGPTDTHVPLARFGGRRMLRAYNTEGTILGGRLIDDGDDVEQAIEEMFADPQVALVHPRFAEFGCFMFEVRRTYPA